MLLADCASGVLLHGLRIAKLRALGREIQAVQPDQRIVDLGRLEAMGGEPSSELLQFGTRIAAPVVFVHKNEHFKHAPI